MDQTLIFAPMGAQAALTFFILGLIPMARFRAVFTRRVGRDDFKLGKSAAVPGDVALPNRNYMNLLELPTLFFAVCLMFFVAHRVTGAALWVAWTFVALRAVHSLVHITYNNVLHRMTVFALSNFALMALWLMFFLRY